MRIGVTSKERETMAREIGSRAGDTSPSQDYRCIYGATSPARSAMGRA
jgi:hypothetical protein